MMLETSVIRMRSGRLFLTLLYLYALWFVGVLALLFLGALTAGFILDVRWAIVALMILFIVTPLLMAFLYFFHGLRPATAINSTDHTLRFTTEAVTMRVMKEAPTQAEEETQEEEQPEQTVLYEKTHGYREIEKIIAGKDGYLLILDSPERGFIWLPYNAFGSDSTLLYDIIRNINKKREIGNENT